MEVQHEREWPEEAGPRWLVFRNGAWLHYCDDDSGWTEDDHAADLHALAGLRWLVMRLDEDSDPSHLCVCHAGNGSIHIWGSGYQDNFSHGSTLLHAVHAAIMAVKGAE